MTDNPSGNTSNFGTPITVLLLVLGFTSAGMWLARSPSTPAEPSRVTPQSTNAATVPVAHPADEVTPSSSFLRPLALIATAIGPEPLFAIRTAGAPELTEPYRLAVDRIGAGDACLRSPSNSGVKSVSPYAEWRLSAGECAIAAELKNRARAQGISVGIIVTTLPDWVDSNLGWMADPILDAIQGAAAQLHYSLSGFDLVDAEPSPEDIRPKGSVWPFPKVHESTPAALLFRNGSPPGSGPTLLLVLLVGEAATSGVHSAAMATALDIALQWQQPSRSEGTASGWSEDFVRILGPTYSGSAASFQLALKDAIARHNLPMRDRAWFRLVSGSATSPGNRDALEGALHGISTFSATTRSDPEELSAVARYLGRTNRGWQCGLHVGLLVEANTAWGGQVVGTGARGGGDNCGNCLADPKGYFDFGGATENPLPCATVAHFPLHISRLRAAAQSSQAAAASPLGPRSTVAVDLGESLPPTDQIPAETPKLTAATVETMMSGLFGVLRDDEVTAIGIFATDKRDHIYLAQEIAQHRPNVQPFTLESSLLYLHPDVAGFVRGTIIASTYPLNPRTQSLTRLGRPAAQQFGGSPAQGIFNALVMLMGRDQSLIDYREPMLPSEGTSGGRPDCGTTHSCAPPIWLSVVSRDALLPLTTDVSGGCRLGSGASAAYVECSEAPIGARQGMQDPRTLVHPYLTARHFRLVLVGVVIALILIARVVLQHWIDERVDALGDQPTRYRPWKASVRSWRRQLFRTSFGRSPPGFEAEHLAAVAAIRGATLAIFLWAIKMAVGYLCDGFRIPLWIGQAIYGFLAALALLYLIRQILVSFWGAVPAGPDQRRGRAAALVFALVTLLAIVLGRIAFRASLLIPACVTIVFVAGIVAVASDVQPSVRARDRLVAHWRRVPALIGIAAFAALWMDLAFTHWAGSEALFYVDRSLDIGSFISPAATILLICLSLLWWGMWNLHRIYLLALPETTVGIGPLLREAAVQAAIPSYSAFRAPTQVVGWPLAPLAAALVLALIYGRSYVGSIDGFAFGVFLLVGPVCIVAITGHTLAHSAQLGSAVVRLLRALERHPSVEVFQTVGKSSFRWAITFDEPRFRQLAPLLRCLDELAQLLNTDDAACAALPGPKELSLFVSGELEQLRRRHFGEIGPVALRRRDWRSIDRIVTRFARILRATRWHTKFDPSAYPAPLVSALPQMEFAVGFQAALILRALLTRLISGFTIVFGALLLLLFAHLLYSFQGRVYWLSLDALSMALAAVFAVRLLFTLERDTVMSNIWRTTPGRISLFGGLTWRMAGYAAITVVTLFVVFFPELAGRTGDWLATARTALQ